MNHILINSTLTLNSAASTARLISAHATKPAGVSPIVRTLVCQWDRLAVIGLMASSAVYGAYALTQMTGF